MTDIKWDVKQLLKVSGAFWQTCALQTAVALDVFTVLDKAALTCEDTAQKLDVPVDGLSRLLNVLTGMKLLEKSGGLYTDTADSRLLLSKHSTGYTGFIISHHHS